MDGAADVAETTYTPFQSEPDAAPVRLIVRRVKPTPGSQLALVATYSYHGFITNRDGEMLELEADHRRHAEIENAIRDLKYGVGLNHLPSGRFAANGAWLAVQVMAHNLARWTARIGLGERIVTTKTLRRRFFALAGRLTVRHAPHPASATALALGNPVQSRLGPGCERFHSQLDDPSATDPPSCQLNVPANSRHLGPRALSPCPIPPSPSPQPLQAAIGAPKSACRPPPNLPSTRIRARTIASVTSSPLPVSSRRPSVSIGGFGLSLLPRLRVRLDPGPEIAYLCWSQCRMQSM